ncbi:MAG: class I SAM-dependent methyltransferase [Deltaproteobacteria bacterium]|nr:class I SAM-dependent methyltransferase [Deltaproteobacteria bacterium]
MAELLATPPDRAAPLCLELFQDLLGNCRPRNFAVRFWDGSILPPEPGEAACFTLVLRHPGAPRRMLWPLNEVSLGEAYIHGDFDVEGDFESAFALADYLVGLRLGTAERLRLGRKLLILPAGGSPLSGRKPPRLRGLLHSRKRDAAVVTYHYDVSNEFYSLWLDSRMVYSAAYFASPDEDLDAAQERKLDYVCRKLRLRPGERFLDIGCGWGGLILHAVQKYGVEAVGITLSRPQADYATERIRRAGLAERCRVEVCDYRDRDEPDGYDKLASVGMFEHVGESRLPEYFRCAWRLLRPGGVFLNHGIACSLSEPPRPGPLFADRYVFPDGELLPISTTLRVAERSGFEVRDVESLREHYVLTLRHWARRLQARYDEALRAAGEVTCRTWRLYLSGAAYGFRIGRTGVYQALLSKPDRGRSGLPLTRADWYP